jgi:hypothetical protein
MREAVISALRAHGALTLRELQQSLGPKSRGSCHVFVLDYFVSMRGLSATLRAALSALLWTGAVEIVPGSRRSLLVRLAR